MTEMQMLFMFCVLYSGAISVVIWANLVSQQRRDAEVEAHRVPPRKYG